MTPKKPGEKTSFCTNCGQPVEGKTATLAASPDVVFCCVTGDRLTAKGTCPNPACPFFEKKPVCTA